MIYVALGLAVLALAAGGLAWYNGSRARREAERADREAKRASAAEAAVGALKSVNTELRGALERQLVSLAARNVRDAIEDARTATRAGNDAGLAADLLNRLHPDDSGTGNP